MKRQDELHTGDCAKFLRIGAGFFKSGDYAGAERCAFVATTADATSVDAWVLLGAARAKLLNMDDALVAFETAARLRPDDTQRWVDLAECHLAKMSYKNAAAVLRRAMELDPNGEHPAGRRARALVGRTLVNLRKR